MRRAMSATMAVLLAAGVGAGTAWADSEGGVHQVSKGDPTASCAVGGESGTNYPSAEVEPYVAVNPLDPRASIGVFQQDRWSDGGAHAGGVVWTRDGVHWAEGLLPFGTCGAKGGTAYERASDFWVSFGPDGAAYSTGLEFDDAGFRNGVGAATSLDGGAHWKYAQPIIADNNPAIVDDKNSVTADPIHPGTAYQVWDRLDQPFNSSGRPMSFDGPAYFSVTHDHGRTWSTPRAIVNTSLVPNSQTIGNIIVADSHTGRLYDFFDSLTYADPTTSVVTDAHYAFISSDDGGKTWSAPKKVANDTSLQDVDPNAPTDPTKFLRTGSGLPNVAIDPVTGELYLAYEGSDFTAGQFDQVELVHSTNGGKTWSAPSRVSQDPQVEAFTPSIAVDKLGTVSISYYDVRDLQPGNTTTLPTSTWLLSFPRGHQQQTTERRILADFDVLLAPYAGGHFLGDYEGLASVGWSGVRPFFVTTANGPADPTDVFTGVFFDSSELSAPSHAATLAPALTAGVQRAAQLRKTAH
jgi:hypothetical protein